MKTNRPNFCRTKKVEARHRVNRILAIASCFLAVSAALGKTSDTEWDRRDKQILTIDHFVTHISTVPATKGKVVGLFVRERVEAGKRQGAPAVLMLHGTPISSTPAFDVPFRDYSWMEFLARAGFDVYAMDVTGFGLSPTPMMDDPCNASPSDQTNLLGAVTAPCAPRYPFHLTTSETEWDEINTVVDYIRHRQHAEKISLIGWSMGGPRVGGYAARYPEKVDKLVLSSPVYNRAQPSVSPSGGAEEPGIPLQIRTMQFNNWDAQVACTNEFDPAIRDVINSEIRKWILWPALGARAFIARQFSMRFGVGTVTLRSESPPPR